jgi:predicted  nucleic acid-binding Zn-ribbon protein
MEKIKNEEVVNLYRKLLEPMGYNVIPKPTEKELDAKIWKPADAEAFNKMASVELEKHIQDLKAQQTSLNKKMADIKDKVTELMNQLAKNEVTESLYTGMYAQNAISKQAIRIESAALADLSKRIDYLQNKKKEALIKETFEALRKEVKDITDIEVVKQLGGPELKVSIK